MTIQDGERMRSSDGVERAMNIGVGLVLGLGLVACAAGKDPPAADAEAREGSKAAEPAVASAEATPKAETEASPEGTLDASALPGSILFVSERDGNLEVYRWRAGKPLERLTHDPRADFVGEVWDDGSRWVRVTTEDGASPEEHREQMLWIRPDAKPTLIGPAGRRARGASWAPDRSYAVFESDAEGAFSDLWRWQPDGTRTRLTRTEQGAFEPAVSPDGASIAYVSTADGNPELYVMKADGSEPRRLTDWRRDDLSPRWSPDGTRLAFLRRERGGERLFVLHLPAEGEPREQRLLPTAEGEQVKHADHAWSPDGRSLVYTVHRPKTTPKVVLTTADGATTKVLSPSHLRATMPSWSPDGRYVAFVGTEGEPEALDLYVVAIEGGAWARLTRDPAPDWLPRWSTP